MRAPLNLLVAAIAAGLVTALAATAVDAAEPGEGPTPPNIVVISSDDQALNTFSRELMPRTFHKLVDRATTFSNAIAATPLCCPSRAAFVTGQYGHNNGVLRNNYAFLEEKQNILPVWLQQAGYSTAHLGKYMNKFDAFVPNPAEAPAGWDFWRTTIGSPSYFDFTLGEDGTLVNYKGLDHYITNELSLHAIELIEEMPEPFYIQLDHYAPHASSGTSSARCDGFAAQSHPAELARFRRLKPPKPPSFDEQDVGDKGGERIWPAQFGKKGEKHLRRLYRCTAASVFGLDRGIAFVIDELIRRGLFDDTVFVFWSDNGYLFGEHRLTGKGVPFDESLRVPVVIKAPGQVLPRVARTPVSNVDLAPTLADYAGATPCLADDCRIPDGRSLAPLVEGTGATWAGGRTLLFESDPVARSNGPNGGKVKSGASYFCNYRGLWDGRHSYITFRPYLAKKKRCRNRPLRHLYDLREDPFQTEALAKRKQKGKRRRWNELLPQHLTCAGHDGAAASPCP